MFGSKAQIELVNFIGKEYCRRSAIAIESNQNSASLVGPSFVGLIESRRAEC